MLRILPPTALSVFKSKTYDLDPSEIVTVKGFVGPADAAVIIKLVISVNAPDCAATIGVVLVVVI